MASNGVTRPPALDVTMQEILDALKAVSFRPQVIDNLTSQDSGAPLSANQGRVLKNAIDDIVTQSITDGDTSHAPSGDAVHDALNAIRPQSKTISYTSRITTVYRSSCFLVGHLLCISFNVMTSTSADAEFAELPYTIASDGAYDFGMNKANGNVCNGYISGKKMYFNAPVPSGEGVLCCICVPVTIS